jgi:hypothetical protein
MNMDQNPTILAKVAETTIKTILAIGSTNINPNLCS